MSDSQFSMILATDTYETIRPVVERLRRQTIARQIELVLVAPSTDSVEQALAHQQEFSAVRIVEHPTHQLAPARAAGIRAATAPVVFVGETHSYPQPGMAEALLKAFDGPWAAIAPAFGNANPKSVLSWAGCLSDYGRWIDGLPAGEVSEVPFYNAAYRRSVLVGLGDRLPHAISHGDELPVTMKAHGHRTYFEPAARIDHVNVAPLADWVRERYVAGMLIASHRAQRWSLARRLFYIAASPLIPVVLTRRVLPGTWQTVRRLGLPLMTVAAVVFGMIAKAAGELLGYAGWTVDAAERQMHEYEMHKLAYAAPAKT